MLTRLLRPHRLLIGVCAVSTSRCDSEDSLDSLKARLRSLAAQPWQWDALGRGANDLLASAGPAQVGYGFVMGFASGFCLKKVCI